MVLALDEAENFFFFWQQVLNGHLLKFCNCFKVFPFLGGAKSDLMKDSSRAILGFTKETQKIETDCSTPVKNLNKFKFRCCRTCLLHISYHIQLAERITKPESPRKNKNYNPKYHYNVIITQYFYCKMETSGISSKRVIPQLYNSQRVMVVQHCLWKTILNHTQLPEEICGGRGQGRRKRQSLLHKNVPFTKAGFVQYQIHLPKKT